VTIRHASEARLTIPVAPETSPFAGEPPTPNIKLLRAAGPMVSWVEEHHDPRGGRPAHGRGRARGHGPGAPARRAPRVSPAQIGLGPRRTRRVHGLVCSLGTVSPAAPMVRDVAAAAQPLPVLA
jgi:hypothetical protein